MKPIRLLGLAVLAAMACVNVSSATAESTVLCKVDENPCAAGNKVTHVHEVSSAYVLDAFFGVLLCNDLFLGDVTGTGVNETVTGTHTYANCVRDTTGNPEPCLFAEVNGPSIVTIVREGHETAKVTGESEVKVKCGSVVDCTYNGEGLAGTAKGPLLSSKTNGEVLFDEQTMHKVSGFLCPSEAKLSVTITSLAATYITS